MSVFAKDNVYGLDFVVKTIQQDVFDYVSYDANVRPYGWEGDVDVYGLIYRKQITEGLVPETWLGTGTNNKEYSRVFVNDKISASIGFLETGVRNLENWTATLDAILTIRLDLAYASRSDLRSQEHAILMFQRALKYSSAVSKPLQLKQGVEVVFSGFYNQNIRNRDMYPWLVCSMPISVQYSDNIDCF
jgi:hypothetical protein